jgi:hypothetical protein
MLRKESGMKTHHAKNGFATLIACTSIAVLLPDVLFAQLLDVDEDRELELSVGYGYSDNVARTDIDTVSSDITYVGLGANWNIERPGYELSLLSDLNYIFYSEDVVDNRTDGNLDARLTAHLVEDRLDWYVADNFSQLRVDPNAGDTPDNLREFNVLYTGLNWTVPFNARTFLNVSAQYSDRRVKDIDDLNSNEISAGLNLFRQIRPTTRIGLVVNGSNVKYDDAIDTEYDIYRGFVRYESELASGEVLLDIGANKLDNKSTGESSDLKPLYRLSWTRDLTERSSFSLSGSHTISDLGTSVSGSDASGVGQGNPGRLNPTSSPFQESRGDATLQINYERTVVRFRFSGTNQQYADPLEDDFDLLSVGLGITRQLPADFTLNIGGSVGERTSHSTGLKGKDTTANVALRKSLGRRLSMALPYTFRRRSDSTTGGYRENQYRLDLIGQLFKE